MLVLHLWCWFVKLITSIKIDLNILQCTLINVHFCKYGIYFVKGFEKKLVLLMLEFFKF